MSAPRERPWSEEDIQLLGTMPDREVARHTGRRLAAVQRKRLKLKIKSWKHPGRKDVPRDPETTRLRFGPYVPPRTRRGQCLFCELRGKVVVGDYSDGPIPWPMKRKTRSIILCGDLVRAVQEESEVAVAHHWGVCAGTVTKWRAALEVSPITKGTRQVKSYAVTEAMTPAVREHISGMKTGVPRQLSTAGEARLKAALHRPKTPRWFASMARHFAARRGVPVDPNDRPWTAQEEQLLGTQPDQEIARLLHRSPGAVTARRHLKGIEYVNPKLRPWEAEELHLLGQEPDAAIAARTGHSLRGVQSKRQQLGLLVRPHPEPWTAREEALLGQQPDMEVARLLGRDRNDVRRRRVALGLSPAAVHPRYEYWTPEQDKLLGTAPDSAVAKKVGRSAACVTHRRLRLGVASFRSSKTGKQPGMT
jgi:hypothetical protein